MFLCFRFVLRSTFERGGRAGGRAGVYATFGQLRRSFVSIVGGTRVFRLACWFGSFVCWVRVFWLYGRMDSLAGVLVTGWFLLEASLVGNRFSWKMLGLFALRSSLLVCYNMVCVVRRGMCALARSKRCPIASPPCSAMNSRGDRYRVATYRQGRRCTPDDVRMSRCPAIRF